MKAKVVIGIIVVIVGLYLAADSIGEYGTPDNLSETWLSGIFTITGLWLCLTKKEIF